MKNILKFTLVGTILIFLFSGCTRYEVNVDSMGSIQNKTKYVLMSGLEGVSETDLEFREYANYINNALKMKGFEKVSFDEADVIIFLSYGISRPQERSVSHSTPIYGTTGVSSSTSTSDSRVSGNLVSYGSVGQYNGNIQTTKTTQYTPSYGVVGYKNSTNRYTIFTRYYKLRTLDIKQKIELWNTMVTSTGSSGDLRRVLPVLVGASQQYIGVNTGKKIRLEIGEEDERVLEVKGI